MSDDIPSGLLRRLGRQMTVMQWEILYLLWQRRGSFIHREVIMDVLWARKEDPPSDTVVRVHIHNIRHFLVGSGYSIITKWGFGYGLYGKELPPPLPLGSLLARGASR